MEEESSESSGGFFSSMTNGTDKPAKVDVLTLSAEEEDETTKRVSLDETTTTQRSTSPAADDETTTSPAARVETGEDGGHDEAHRWDLVRRRHAETAVAADAVTLGSAYRSLASRRRDGRKRWS